MKSRKLLALFLAIFMFASLIVPVSAETITPDANVTNGIVGYDAALVEKVDLTNVKKTSEYATYPTEKAYKITSVEDWDAFDALVTSTATYDASNEAKYYLGLVGVTIYLDADLDFEGKTRAPIGDTQNGTGSYEEYWGKFFGGMFDGQGHTIKNLVIRPESADSVQKAGYYGLFAVISGTKENGGGVKNLIIDSTVTYDADTLIDGTDYTPTAILIGSLVGNVNGFNKVTDKADVATITISNVCNKANLTINSRQAGGLVAYAKLCHLEMSNCSNLGNLTQTGTAKTNVVGAGVGGLVGALGEKNKTQYQGGTISNCRNAGNITSTVSDTAGGIVGGAFAAKTSSRTLTINNCINNGFVKYTGSDKSWARYGGVIGYTETFGSIILNYCKNYGEISGNFTSTCTDELSMVATATNNCEKNYGKADPTYNMVAKYYQLSKDAPNGVYSLRLIALHNGELTDIDAYSYDITIAYGDAQSKTASTGKLYTVKTSIIADKMGEGATVVTNEMLGCKWISAVRVDNIPTNIGTITVTITPTMYKGETETTAAPITFTVDPAVVYA